LQSDEGNFGKTLKIPKKLILKLLPEGICDYLFITLRAKFLREFAHDVRGMKPFQAATNAKTNVTDQ